MELNKYDYKRFEELLEQMIKEEKEQLSPNRHLMLCIREEHANNKYCLTITKLLIKQRQNITLK